MGRRKISIAPITDDRNRSVTFLKRKNGLFKKAYELGILCSADVAVIVFSNNGKLFEFSSGDMDQILLKYSHFNGPVHERRGPHDYASKDTPDLTKRGLGGKMTTLTDEDEIGGGDDEDGDLEDGGVGDMDDEDEDEDDDQPQKKGRGAKAAAATGKRRPSRTSPPKGIKEEKSPILPGGSAFPGLRASPGDENGVQHYYQDGHLPSISSFPYPQPPPHALAGASAGNPAYNSYLAALSSAAATGGHPATAWMYGGSPTTTSPPISNAPASANSPPRWPNFAPQNPLPPTSVPQNAFPFAASPAHAAAMSLPMGMMGMAGMPMGMPLGMGMGMGMGMPPPGMFGMPGQNQGAPNGIDPFGGLQQALHQSQQLHPTPAQQQQIQQHLQQQQQQQQQAYEPSNPQLPQIQRRGTDSSSVGGGGGGDESSSSANMRAPNAGGLSRSNSGAPKPRLSVSIPGEGNNSGSERKDRAGSERSIIGGGEQQVFTEEPEGFDDEEGGLQTAVPNSTVSKYAHDLLPSPSGFLQGVIYSAGPFGPQTAHPNQQRMLDSSVFDWPKPPAPGVGSSMHQHRSGIPHPDDTSEDGDGGGRSGSVSVHGDPGVFEGAAVIRSLKRGSEDFSPVTQAARELEERMDVRSSHESSGRDSEELDDAASNARGKKSRR